ncbi:MAG: hypothetical protein ABIO35_08180 [Nitrobacter sp.]
MSELEILGEITSWDHIVPIFRARADKLELSREGIDDVCGLTPGYASKLLAAKPIKNVGKFSFDSLCGGLAVKFIAVVDTEALARFEAMRSKAGKRATNMVRADGRHFVVTANFLRKIAVKGGEARAKIPKWKLKAIGRKGAAARWAKARAYKADNA